MSTLPVLPCSIGFAPITPGWFRGIPALGGPQAPNYPSGVRYTPRNMFADSPPIGDELYVVTGFTIPYSVAIDNAAATATYSVQAQITLMIDGDAVASAYDSQQLATTAAADATTSGIFDADLVNPIIVAPGQTLAMQLGANWGGATSNTGGQIDAGYQTVYNPAGATFVAQAFPSALRYQITHTGAGR